jgi:predicted CoA-binding protein
LAEVPVPVIWKKSLHVEEHASDLAELPVPVIWQNCLSV